MVDKMGDKLWRPIAAGVLAVTMGTSCTKPEETIIPAKTELPAKNLQQSGTSEYLSISQTPGPIVPEVKTEKKVVDVTPETVSTITMAGEVFYKQNHEWDCTVAAAASLLVRLENDNPIVKEKVRKNIDKAKWEMAEKSLRERYIKAKLRGSMDDRDVMEEYILNSIPFSINPDEGFRGVPDELVDFEHMVNSVGVYFKPVAERLNQLLEGSGVQAKVMDFKDEGTAYRTLDDYLKKGFPVAALGNGFNPSAGRLEETDPVTGVKFNLVPIFHTLIVYGKEERANSTRYLINTGGDGWRTGGNFTYRQEKVKEWELTKYSMMVFEPTK